MYGWQKACPSLSDDPTTTYRIIPESMRPVMLLGALWLGRLRGRLIEPIRA